MAQAVDLLDEGKIDRAEALLRQVVKQFPGTESAKIASDRLEQIDKDREAAAALAEAKRLAEEEARRRAQGGSTTGTEALEFPPEIRAALIGIVSSGTPVVLIGDEVVPEGATVKKNDEVKVKEIRKNEVVFLFDKREFTIPLDALTTPDGGPIEFKTVEKGGGI